MYNKKMIFSTAWSFVKKNGLTLSEALKKAWTNAKVVKGLKKGIVKFYFEKVDGSIREAFGTLATGMVPAVGSGRRPCESCQVYYDTEKSDWRCFKKVNLIGLAVA